MVTKHHDQINLYNKAFNWEFRVPGDWSTWPPWWERGTGIEAKSSHLICKHKVERRREGGKRGGKEGRRETGNALGF